MDIPSYGCPFYCLDISSMLEGLVATPGSQAKHDALLLFIIRFTPWKSIRSMCVWCPGIAKIPCCVSPPPPMDSSSLQLAVESLLTTLRPTTVAMIGVYNGRLTGHTPVHYECSNSTASCSSECYSSIRTQRQPIPFRHLGPGLSQHVAASAEEITVRGHRLL